MQRALSLEDTGKKGFEPLAERLRPKTWDDFEGIDALDRNTIARLRSGKGRPPSCILWGPPGVGKTTIARLIGKTFDLPFQQLSAVLSGVKEIREIVAEAKRSPVPYILFIDEIHRFNKAQQDAFLPHVEDGTIILLGATTENPSFYVTQALLSRCAVLVLKSLDDTALDRLVKRGTETLGLSIEDVARSRLISSAAGDGRKALNLIEGLFSTRFGKKALTESVNEEEMLSFLSSAGTPFYDRNGEEHYNIVSAFIKSLRGSNADAALYWAFRMIEGGEDPRFVIRRMMIFASEDIGNADPRALTIAVSTSEAYEKLGLPEGKIPIAHCVTYLATAPKSNRSYVAMHAAIDLVKKHPHAAVPLHLRNAPTTLMKSLEYGKGYEYPHDAPGGFVQEASYLPDAIKTPPLYTPSDRGYEKVIDERMRALRQGSGK